MNFIALFSVFVFFLSFTKCGSFCRYYITGSSSLFLSEIHPIFRFLGILIISFSKYKKIILNPLFIIHILSSGSDFLFLIPLLCFDNKWYITLITALLRQILVKPYPGVGLMWLINSHSFPEFRELLLPFTNYF
jgi:hypothetical protein